MSSERLLGGAVHSDVRPLGGLDELEAVVKEGKNLRAIGCILCWLLSRALVCKELGLVASPLAWLLVGGDAGKRAVHRPLSKEVFPLRLGTLEGLASEMAKMSLAEVLAPEFAATHSSSCWLLASLWFCNSVHGCRGVPRGRWRRAEVTAVSSLQATIDRALSDG